MPGRVRQQAAPEFEGIFTALRGKFIDETFGEERVLRIAYRAPVRYRNTDLGGVILDLNIGDRVLDIRHALHAGEVHSIAHAAKWWAGDARGPSHRPTFGVQSTGKAGIRCRAIHV